MTLKFCVKFNEVCSEIAKNASRLSSASVLIAEGSTVSWLPSEAKHFTKCWSILARLSCPTLSYSVVNLLHEEASWTAKWCEPEGKEIISVFFFICCSHVFFFDCLLPLLPTDVGFNGRVFDLLGCYAAYVGSCLLKFWDPKTSVRNYQCTLCNNPAW